ncbi:hypothetical protein [Bacteroides reticulotermitis]|uniref:Uncharacterized protein n=2 Tax=Bacteroides reticulotermitis TaxID=1133319 RepID=W4UR02_9BACE|nr:hypothetical protein [Bacteroides reticulotermitis]MBB4043033.1 hypothetical protein [Bacteroides reticulotermitis]GAE82929.1 hypothetical protein JCM10512_1172 [Bacteroides reticulotermitis JCM 10512]
MRNKCLSGILLFLCLQLVGCSDDEKEIYSLSFEKEYYECSLLRGSYIPIRGGNRDYTVEVADPGVLEVKIDLSSSIGMGNLYLTSKQKGETVITVRDNVTNETVLLNIKVVDAYMGLKNISSHGEPYVLDTYLFLTNNENKDFYVYDTDLNTEKYKGTYAFSVENYKPYLTLSFSKEVNGKSVHKYSLLGSLDNFFAVSKILLGMDWGTSTANVNSVVRSDVMPTVYMVARDLDTDEEVTFVFNASAEMPYNVL